MVDEFRAQRLDLAARATFAQDGERIKETRTQLSEDTRSAEDAGRESAQLSAQSLSQAAGSGYVEVA